MIFKQVFRVAFVALIWKQYKSYIISTILLLLYLYLISSLHSDFLKLAELEQEVSGLKMSYVYKWAASAGGILIYFLYHYLRPNKKVQAETRKERIEQELAALDDKDDPFAAIRSRDKLRSRADFLEEEKSKK